MEDNKDHLGSSGGTAESLALTADVRVLGEPQPSTPGENGFAPLPEQPYPVAAACRWPDCGCHAPQGPNECRARGVQGTVKEQP